MSRTFAAAAPGLPVLRSTALPELEGTALRLHVAPVMTAIWSDGPRGYALLSLCPGDDPDEPAALVRLPLMQCEALERACAAFNCIMSAAEREPPASITVLGIPTTEQAQALNSQFPDHPEMAITTSAASRAQAIATAAAQLLVLAAFLPAVAGRCLGFF